MTIILTSMCFSPVSNYRRVSYNNRNTGFATSRSHDKGRPRYDKMKYLKVAILIEKFSIYPDNGLDLI